MKNQNLEIVKDLLFNAIQYKYSEEFILKLIFFHLPVY